MLGPLLFLIYINDIVTSSNLLSFVLFDDDTTVYIQNDSIESAIEILNTELAEAALGFDFNKLTLNVNKTQMIMLSRKKILTSQNYLTKIKSNAMHPNATSKYSQIPWCDS